MEKPAERLARQYQELVASGVPGDKALKEVSDAYDRTVNVIRRQQSILAHQAKASGRAMSLREAQGLLKVVGWAHGTVQKGRQPDYDGMHNEIKRKVTADMQALYAAESAVWQLGEDRPLPPAEVPPAAPTPPAAV